MKKKNGGTRRNRKTTGKRKRFRAKKAYDINFSGGDLSSDGGAILLQQVDRNLRLSEQISEAIKDPRRQSQIEHLLPDMVRQRLYAIALGYEDLNDHNSLRKDQVLQKLLHKESELASTSTLCRFEHSVDRDTMIKMHKILLEHFISSHKVPPEQIILDFDATDDLTHGNQEGSFFHGYYDHHCFLPLYVFCGDFPLVAYLRPGNQDGAKHALAILSLLVKQIRAHWPSTKITFRADSGFCRHHIFDWCERNDVGFICGMATNTRLENLAEPYVLRAKEYFDHTQEKQRIFADFEYAAKSWKHTRRIILKAEHLEKGSNPRFVVTNLDGEPQALYEQLYCARGDMENRIKEQQLGLFADRTSCHGFMPNQFRLLMSTCAYVLLAHIRRVALSGTEFAKAQATTIRLKFLKIGCIVMSNTRRIRFMLSSAYPLQELFLSVLAKFTPW